MDSSDRDLLSEWFTQLKGQNVEVSVPQRGYKMDMIKMAHENAETFLEERRRQWQHQIDKTGGAVKKLAEVLDLPRLPERMECFDISHTQGAETVASMVVFEGGKPAKKEYRRFKLKLRKVSLMTLSLWLKLWNDATVRKQIGLCQTSLLSMVVKVSSMQHCR